MNINEQDTEILNQIKRWLAEGATIKATDPKEPFLVFQPNGVYIGGLIITYPKKEDV